MDIGHLFGGGKTEAVLIQPRSKKVGRLSTSANSSSFFFLGLTDGGEEHIVQEEGDGDDEQHELPGLPGLVEVGADPRAGDVVAGFAHFDDWKK